MIKYWTLAFALICSGLNAQTSTIQVAPQITLPSLVILPTNKDERIKMVADIQTQLNRIGCNAGTVTGYWTPEGDGAMARLSEVRPDTIGVRLSLSLLSFLEQMPSPTCANAVPVQSNLCVAYNGGEVCESDGERPLARALQTELNRMRCGAGTPDGVWGRNSDAALRRATNEAPSLGGQPRTVALLQALVDQPANLCPLVCSVREVKSNGRCVTKTCPSGQKLSSKGNCYTPQVVRKTCPEGQTLQSDGTCVAPQPVKKKRVNPPPPDPFWEPPD